MRNNSKSPTILVIDDDKEVRYSLERVLASREYEVITAAGGEEGIQMVKARFPEVIFLDIRMAGMDGLETLQRIRNVDPQAMVVLMTAYGTTQTAIEAMKHGAFDYAMKPFDIAKIVSLTESALQARHDLRKAGNYRSVINSDDYQEGMVGRSEAMQAVFKMIGQSAPSEATVLITGESGTGKELVARCIHQHSHRSKKTFMAVNCAAIPENLIESELFGHERGAFTGAISQRIGRFEQCDGGTIFLDEVGDMALPIQTKILRFLQEGEIQRVGGGDSLKLDVRILAATNRDLESLVAEKKFREDLYYRLNVVRLRLPALRERMEDLPALVDFILQKLQKSRRTKIRKVSPEAMEVMQRHRWPGNIRELENLLHRSAVLAQGDAILIRDLPPELGEAPVVPEVSGPEAAPNLSSGTPVPPDASGTAEGIETTALLDDLYHRMRQDHQTNLLGEVEREFITRSLRETRGSQAKAAAILGMTRSTLRKRLDQFGLDPKQPPAP